MSGSRTSDLAIEKQAFFGALGGRLRFRIFTVFPGIFLVLVFGESLSAEGNSQIGGFHSLLPNLHSLFHREI